MVSTAATGAVDVERVTSAEVVAVVGELYEGELYEGELYAGSDGDGLGV